MQNNETFSDKLTNIRTLSDVQALQGEVGVAKNSLYKSESGLTQAQIEEKEKYLDGIKTQLLNLKIFKLTISFSPRSEFIDSIFAWIKTNIGEGIVLDFGFDPKIIGGVMVEWQGKYIDLSVSKLLEEKYGL